MPNADRASWPLVPDFIFPGFSLPSMAGRAREHTMREFIQLHRNTVPYIGQSYSWDCGLACVEMALRSRGVKRVSFSELRDMCSTKSVWSIDIAYLLHRFGVRTTFFTITKGVRPEYRKQEFYKRRFPQDTRRVNQLFTDADQTGVRVIQRSVQLSEICHAVLERDMLVLVLMDKRYLKCSLCDKGRLAALPSFSSRNSPGFLGHYVLIYAYHPGTNKFLIKDPASHRETCVISADILEEGRKVFGTDQDIIFISDVEEEQGESWKEET